MTKAILMSIHPKWAAKIYAGEKTIEWRKSFPIKCWFGGMKIFLYETRPIGKITGCFELRDVSTYNKNEYECKFIRKDYVEKNGCLSIEELNKYQGNSKRLFAWCVMNALRYEKPLNLASFGLNRPPQSWQYVEVK